MWGFTLVYRVRDVRVSALRCLSRRMLGIRGVVFPYEVVPVYLRNTGVV